MLIRLVIQNYRCYENHEIELKEETIAIGKNNAGKSTLIEALRLISIITQRYQRLNFYPAPRWTNLHRSYLGVSPSIKNIKYLFEGDFYRYGEPPAKITAYFSNNLKIELYVGENGQLFAVLYDAFGKQIKNKPKAISANFPVINILPQISPLLLEEDPLSVEYVLSNLSSALASHHFRNQIDCLFNDYYKKFKRLAEDSWPGVRINKFDRIDRLTDKKPHLYIIEDDFVSEIGRMGHGIQVWMQIMWFLARMSSDSIIILDEPDVYLHADLQRKLIRMLRNRYKQIIITTHSTEIISEIEPESILIVDKKRKSSVFATTFTTLNKAINMMGSIHNIALSRLWSSKKMLIVEGKDVAILKRIQEVIDPRNNDPIDLIPNIPIGGWGGWSYAVGSKLLLKNAGDDTIKVYCIFDSDYHTKKEIADRYTDAKAMGVNLHVWNKKEIENYLIVPSAICRMIAAEKTNTAIIDETIVKDVLDIIIDKLKDNVIDCIATEIHNKNKKLSVKTANIRARTLVAKKWRNKIDIVSGKEVLKRLNEWAESKYGASFSVNKLAKELRQDEIDNELREVITGIKDCSTSF